MLGLRALIVCLLMVLLVPVLTYGQPNVYTFHQLDSLQQSSNRKVVVFIHTDWCKYCQAMENTTFRNQGVVQKLNESFWFLKLNSESKQEINYGGVNYRFKPSGAEIGTHELAQALGTQNGKLSYPSICILNAENQILFQYDQFLSAQQMLDVIEGIEKEME